MVKLRRQSMRLRVQSVNLAPQLSDNAIEIGPLRIKSSLLLTNPPFHDLSCIELQAPELVFEFLPAGICNIDSSSQYLRGLNAKPRNQIGRRGGYRPQSFGFGARTVKLGL